MNKVIIFFKKYWGLCGLLTLWLVVALYNINIYWMLVDDGYDVVFSRTLFGKLIGLNFVSFASQLFENVGRFRPLYWLYQMAEWLIGQNNYHIHHLMHMIIIGLMLSFIYLIVKEITKSIVVSFFASATYLLIPLNAENIVRLGPQEPLMTLFISISFYLMIKAKRVFLTVVFIALALFTKETSVALLPIIFVYYFLERKRRTLRVFITVVFLSAAVVAISLINRGGYGSNYLFDPQIIISNFKYYLASIGTNTLYIFPLTFIIFCLRVFNQLVNKKGNLIKENLFELLFFAGFISFFLIQLPWKYPLERYLMPTAFFFVIFTFLEIKRYLDIKKKTISCLLIIVAVYILSVWGIGLVAKELSAKSYQTAFEKMAAFPKNSLLLMNMKPEEATIEYLEETKIHLSEFWGREDIKVEYLDLNTLPKDKWIAVDTDNFPRRYPPEELGNSLGDYSLAVEDSSKRLVITTPLEIVKQILKKSFSYVLTRKGFTADGLYTYYYSYNDWYFYYEK